MLEKIKTNQNLLIIIAVVLSFSAIIQNLRSHNMKLSVRIEELEKKLSQSPSSSFSPGPNVEPSLDLAASNNISKQEICTFLSGRYYPSDSQGSSERCELNFNSDSEKIQKQIAEILSLSQQNIGNLNEEISFLKARLNSKDGKVDLGKIDPNAKPDPHAPKPPENSLGGGAELKKENNETLCSQTWGEGYCEKGQLKCKSGTKIYFRLGKSPSGLPKIHYVCM